MRSRQISIFLLALLFGFPLSAQWWSGNKEVPDEAWRKGKNDFGAMLLLTPEVNKFFEEWSKPQPPKIVITSTAKRNKPISAIIVFTGAKSINDKCDIRVDFMVLKPDGTEYGSQKTFQHGLIDRVSQKESSRSAMALSIS